MAIPRPGRLRDLTAALAIFAVGLAARALWWPRVMGTGALIPPHGSDEYYHLRRIWHALERFPELLTQDPYVSFPNGGQIVWPPGFDWPLAAIARVFRIEEQASLELFLAWVPAVLGALVAVVTAAVAARAFSRVAGLAAGLLLALLPGHHNYTMVGMVDHHAAAGLAGVLLVGGTMAVTRRSASWPAAAIGLGLGGAASLAIWPGALLQLALLQGLALIWMLGAADSDRARSRGLHLALAQGVAALAIAPFSLGNDWSQYGATSPLVLSQFQPLWFAATAIGAAGLAASFGNPALGRSRGRRFATAGALGVVSAALALALLPELAGSLDYASGWFQEIEDFQLHVRELNPLFTFQDEFDTKHARGWLTSLLFGFPLALGWVVHRAWREGRADLWLLAAWSFAFALLCLDQVRFLNSFAIPYAIVLAAALVAGLGALAERIGETRWRRPALAVAALALVIVGCSGPVAAYYGQRWREAIAFVRGEPISLPRVPKLALFHHTAAGFLRRTSPATAGYLDVEQAPEYGVLCSWGYGHLVRYVAERPVVQDNFGVYGGRETFDLSERYYASTGDEEEALEILKQLRVRYVFVARDGSGHGGPYGARSMVARLLAGRGGSMQSSEGATREPRNLPALTQHRLVFDTAEAENLGALRVFEVVEGALLTGRAPPDSEVLASLPLRTARTKKQPFIYRSSARAGADGRYALRLPYATNAGSAVRSGRYVLSAGEFSAVAQVSKAAVESGSSVAGPDLCAGGCAGLENDD